MMAGTFVTDLGWTDLPAYWVFLGKSLNISGLSIQDCFDKS
jgi:hypothetical protein